MPFVPGERLVFDLKWEFVKAGEAVLEVLPIETINGVEVYHFVLTAETNKYLDLIYKVRDRIDAYADVNMTRSILYKKNQREGRSRRNIVIEFDWEKNEASYSNFGEKIAPIPIQPGTFDPLTAFYYARMIDFEKHKGIERPVTDGKKCIDGHVSVVKKESIEVPLGTFETFVLEPELKDLRGVFEKDKEAKIEVWVSSDKRKFPLKVKSKVIVGSFTGELVSAHGLVE